MAESSPAPARSGVFRRLWGAGPLHLLGHAALIAITAAALTVMFREVFAPRPWNLVLWLLGGAVLHDAVFLPAYSAVNVAAARLLGRRGAATTAPRVPLLNYVRVPIVISGVLLLTYAPRIFAGQPQNFERALGHPPPDYLARWLLVTGVVFAASALAYAVRRFTIDPGSPDPAAPAPEAGPAR